MRVQTMELEEVEPPKPSGANKIRQGVKRAHKKAEVIPLGNYLPEVQYDQDDLSVTTPGDIALINYLRKEVGESEPYVEVPEEDPTSPAQAQGASPAEDDDKARYERWLELNTPISSKVFTRPFHARTDDDWKWIDGERYEAPQRLRRVRVKEDVQTPKGTRTKKRYELVKDDIIRHEVMREIKVSDLTGKTVLVSQTLYSPLNHSPLRNPWSCSCVYLGKRYFHDKKYAQYVRKVHCKNHEQSERRRKEMGKTSAPPVLGSRPVLNRTVDWMMRYPNGSALYPEVLESGIIDPRAASANFYDSCKALDVIQHMEQSMVDIESMMQESVLYHRDDDTLPPQRPEIDRGVREILQFLDEWEEYQDEKRSDSEPELHSEYRWSAANEGFDEDVPKEWDDVSEVHSLPFGDPIEPESFTPSSSTPERTMGGWDLNHVKLSNEDPFDVTTFKRRQSAKKWQKLARELKEDDEVRAAKSKQSQSDEKPGKLHDGGTVIARPDGYVLPANTSDPALLDKVAHAASCLYPQRLVMPELESCVRIDANTLEVTVHGRTQQWDIRTQDGAYKLKRLVDTISYAMNQVLDWETDTLVQQDVLPPDWKELSFESESKASMRKMCLGDICRPKYGHNIQTSYYREVSRGSVPWKQAKKNFTKMLRIAEELADVPVIKAQTRLLMKEIDERQRQDKRLQENVRLWYWEAEQKSKLADEVAALQRMGEPARRRKAAAEQAAALKKTPAFRAKLLEDVRMIKRMRKCEPKLEKRWLRRFKSKFQSVYQYLAERKQPGAAIAANPPTVGEAPEIKNKGQQEVVSPLPTKREDSRDNVIELEVEHDKAPELARYVTTEDGKQLLNLRNQLAEQNELPVEYLDRELCKIYKPALHQNAQRRRANRATLAESLAA